MNWLGLCLQYAECVTGTRLSPLLSSSHSAVLYPSIFDLAEHQKHLNSFSQNIVHFTTMTLRRQALQITLSFITLSTMYSLIVCNSNLHWMSKWAWTQLTSCLPTTPNSHSIDESKLCNLAESCLCLRYWGCLCRHCNVWWEARHHSACWSVKHT